MNNVRWAPVNKYLVITNIATLLHLQNQCYCNIIASVESMLLPTVDIRKIYNLLQGIIHSIFKDFILIIIDFYNINILIDIMRLFKNNIFI